MQYDGLDQTGKALVTSLLSSQGRVMVGKCDELGGPYLQVMEDELIDTVAATPVAISHPQKTFTGGIASADEQDNRNIIFKVLQELPISEMRARSITTYIVNAVAAVEVRVTSVYRSIAQYIQFIESAWKEYALQITERLKTADTSLLKAAQIVRAEFINLVLRTPRYLSGIVEDGRAVFVSAVSETGRMITALTEEGRASFNSIINYTPSDFYILVTKTFGSKIKTSISQGQTTLSAAPYINPIEVVQQHPIKRIWLTAYAAIIGFTETVGAFNIIKYISERLKTLEQRATSLPYNIKETMLFIDSKRRFIWSNLSESTYFTEARKINLLKGIRETLYTLEQQYKKFAQQFSHGIAVAENTSRGILKRLVEFVDINLPIYKWLSGISETGHTIYFNAVSETGKMVSILSEEGRYVVSTFQNYTSSNFWIEIQKTFKHKVGAAIFRNPLTLSSAPYRENTSIGLAVRRMAFLQPYVDGIAVAYENGKTTIARYCNEKMRAALLHTIQLTTSIPTYLSVSDIRKTISWIDIPEVISGIDSRINNISSSLKEHIEAAVTQWKEYGLQFTHNLGVAETSARALTTFRTEFINLVLRVPKLLSGLSETGHTLYNNALSEIGRAATQISEEGRAVVCSLSHSSPAGFTVELQRILKDKVAASHDRITNAFRTYQELAMSIDLRVNHITMNVHEAITYVEAKTSHATKYILNLLDTRDVAITHNVSKMLAQRISAAETYISSATHYLTESTVYSGIANSRFAVTLSDGVALIDNTAASAIVNLKEKYNLLERKLTNIPYELKELSVFSSNYITRSWVTLTEPLTATHTYITTSTYNITHNLKLTATDILHPKIIAFAHAVGFSDATIYHPLKSLQEVVRGVEHQLNNISKPLLQRLRLRDTKIPYIAKLLRNGLAASQQVSRRMQVQRVEFINIILSIPKQLSGITETGLVYLQNSITEVGDTVSTLSSNGRLTISYIVESTQSGFTKTVARPISERLTTSHTIISRSMIHLLEETPLQYVVTTHPLRRFVETIITSGSHLQQLLHVLKETTSMMYSRQSRVTSQLVHRLGIRDIGILNTWRAFIHSISTSYGFLRRPQLILRERVASSYITSRIITSHIGEILRTLQIHSTSMFYNIKESISTIQSFRHRLAGLVTRPYTEIKSISKTTRARLSRNFATLKSYIKDSTASHEGDKK